MISRPLCMLSKERFLFIFSTITQFSTWPMKAYHFYFCFFILMYFLIKTKTSSMFILGFLFLPFLPGKHVLFSLWKDCSKVPADFRKHQKIQRFPCSVVHICLEDTIVFLVDMFVLIFNKHHLFKNLIFWLDVSFRFSLLSFYLWSLCCISHWHYCCTMCLIIVCWLNIPSTAMVF